MSDELSDEAAAAFVKGVIIKSTEYPSHPLWLLVWRECRRRAEALIEKTFQDGVRKGCEISEVWTDREQVIEAERRKAFEAGWMARLVRSRNFEDAYRAYTEAAPSKETNNP